MASKNEAWVKGSGERNQLYHYMTTKCTLGELEVFRWGDGEKKI